MAREKNLEDMDIKEITEAGTLHGVADVQIGELRYRALENTCFKK